MNMQTHTYTHLAGGQTAAVVVNAEHGIEMMTQRLMDFAGERHMCRMIIVNKMDADNSFSEVSDEQAAANSEAIKA